MLLSADKIHDGKQWLPEGSVIELDEQGIVLAVHHDQKEGAVHYEGTLCPGFVNAHCHLELSHMLGAIPEGTGLIGFLLQVMRRRNDFTEAEKSTAREQALNAMLDNGVVAVGDIANTTDTLPLRAQDNLHWYTFVESIGFLPERAAGNFAYALNTLEAFAAQVPAHHALRQAIVPHAPYSVSGDLFALIADHGKGATLSVHNQETEDENHYYRDKSGGFTDFLGAIGIDDAVFTATGKSSVQSYTGRLQRESPLLLVHNTFSSAEDIRHVHQQFPQAFWCLCPNANLYIEGRLPDLEALIAEDAQLCIGTDSLASNHQLSVYAELQAIDRAFPQIGWESLLRWATYNGACALQLQQNIGSLEAGKQPGLVWIRPDHSIQKIA
jgi:cytosine/adenosine deaminase-related metal-dependent hydrolase